MTRPLTLERGRETVVQRLAKEMHRIAVLSLVMWSKQKLVAHPSQGTRECMVGCLNRSTEPTNAAIEA